ncbi:MAG: DUF4199 domain-containing protein [Saprospiraceae bacterium]|nr:DUF4199 domain-containing protein [Saprospiraceae bacterium]
MHPYFKTELKWAVVIGILTILWFVLERLTGFDGDFIEYHNIAGYLYLIPFITIYAFALLEIRTLRGGQMSYATGLKSAFRIAIYSIPLVILASYLKITLISPEFQSNIIEYMITTGADEEEVRTAYSTVPYLLISGAYALTGIIAGSIVMLFIKRQ